MVSLGYKTNYRVLGYIEYSGSQTFAFENKQKMRIMHGVTISGWPRPVMLVEDAILIMTQIPVSMG